MSRGFSSFFVNAAASVLVALLLVLGAAKTEALDAVPPSGAVKIRGHEKMERQESGFCGPGILFYGDFACEGKEAPDISLIVNGKIYECSHSLHSHGGRWRSEYLPLPPPGAAVTVLARWENPSDDTPSLGTDTIFFEHSEVKTMSLPAMGRVRNRGEIN